MKIESNTNLVIHGRRTMVTSMIPDHQPERFQFRMYQKFDFLIQKTPFELIPSLHWR